MKTGKPYIMFGDGQLASCKPISEADLAAFIADCVQQEDKRNQVLPIGGMPICLALYVKDRKDHQSIERWLCKGWVQCGWGPLIIGL